MDTEQIYVPNSSVECSPDDFFKGSSIVTK